MSYILGQKEFILVEGTPLNMGGGVFRSALNTESDVDYLYVPMIDNSGLVKKVNLTDNSIVDIFTTPSGNGYCYQIWIDKVNQKVVTTWRYMSTGDDTFYVFDYNGTLLQSFTTGYYGDTFGSLDYDSKRKKLITINAQYSKIHLLDYDGSGTSGTAGTSGNMYITSIDSGYTPTYASPTYGIVNCIYDKQLDKYLITPYTIFNKYLALYTHDPLNLTSFTTTDYDRSILNGFYTVKDADRNVYVITVGQDPHPQGPPLITQSLVLIDQITLKTVFRYNEPLSGNGFGTVTVDNKRNRFILHNGNYLRFYNKVLI